MSADQSTQPTEPPPAQPSHPATVDESVRLSEMSIRDLKAILTQLFDLFKQSLISARKEHPGGESPHMMGLMHPAGGPPDGHKQHPGGEYVFVQVPTGEASLEVVIDAVAGLKEQVNRLSTIADRLEQKAGHK